MALTRIDLEAVLGFLVDIGDLEFDEPYPMALVARLARLVPCDAATYQEIDLRAKRFATTVSFCPDERAGEEPGPGSAAQADEDALYFALGPCPISDYRDRTNDLSTVRMSDLIDPRRYHELPIFRDYFRPAGLDHAIDLALPAPSGRHRSFILFRRTEGGDFSDRDRLVLETLRPHLAGLEVKAALRRRLRDLPVTHDGAARPGPWDGLTAREREILALAADGRTNAQIAAQLWVAPSTVKKHLEHVYEKLGVGGRTAAAMRAHAR